MPTKSAEKAVATNIRSFVPSAQLLQEVGLANAKLHSSIMYLEVFIERVAEDGYCDQIKRELLLAGIKATLNQANTAWRNACAVMCEFGHDEIVGQLLTCGIYPSMFEAESFPAKLWRLLEQSVTLASRAKDLVPAPEQKRQIEVDEG